TRNQLTWKVRPVRPRASMISCALAVVLAIEATSAPRRTRSSASDTRSNGGRQDRRRSVRRWNIPTPALGRRSHESAGPGGTEDRRGGRALLAACQRTVFPRKVRQAKPG